MIQNVFGIKEFQTNLPQIARRISEIGGHYLITNRSKPSMVAIPFEDYQEIEDILLELNSPGLKKEIQKGRSEYKSGKTSQVWLGVTSLLLLISSTFKALTKTLLYGGSYALGYFIKTAYSREK